MSSKKYFIEFKYNRKGHGNVVLRQDSLIATEVPARTGSLKYEDNELKLVNAIEAGLWRILLCSVDTTEPGMERTPGKGWKIRLYTDKRKFTHYLIHPDGNKPGTLGCIGLLDTDGAHLRYLLDQILKVQKDIEVYINIPSQADREKADMPPKDPMKASFVPGRRERKSFTEAAAALWGRLLGWVGSCLERVINLFCE